jgi:hypothetical protein
VLRTSDFASESEASASCFAHTTYMSKTMKKAKQKTVANIGRDECRWPIGDPRHADFHFCGAPQLPGRPYCELHWCMAFLPARPRQEQVAPVPGGRRAA